jgi:two-component system alkaline phosphatase synthesis response regulator PhoP
VDQDPALVHTLEVALQGLGVDVLTAYSGAQAVRRLGEVHPRIVILDLTLPDVDGFEIFRSIREDPELRETAVIVTHPDPEDTIVFRAFSLGSDCFLAKPIDPREVRTFVSRILA